MSNIERLKFLNKTISSIIQDIEQDQQNQQDYTNSNMYIFTDGGCSNNGKDNSKGAYSALFSTDKKSEFYKFNTSKIIKTEPTNNKAELSAIHYVLETISDNINIFKNVNKNIIICTDSMYSINCIEKWSKNWIKNGWKNSKGEQVKNKDIIKSILDIKQTLVKHIKLSFKHVFSHTDPPLDTQSLKYFLWNGNNIVDEMIKRCLV